MLEQILSFVQNHWILSSLALLVVALLIWDELYAHAGLAKVTAQEAVFLINREQGSFLDLRDASSYANCHLAATIHLPQAECQQKLSSLEKYRAHPLILVGSEKVEVLSTYKLLKAAGFTKIFQLQGGIPAWQEAKFPVIQK